MSKFVVAAAAHSKAEVTDDEGSHVSESDAESVDDSDLGDDEEPNSEDIAFIDDGENEVVTTARKRAAKRVISEAEESEKDVLAIAARQVAAKKPKTKQTSRATEPEVEKPKPKRKTAAERAKEAFEAGKKAAVELLARHQAAAAAPPAADVVVQAPSPAAPASNYAQSTSWMDSVTSSGATSGAGSSNGKSLIDLCKSQGEKSNWVLNQDGVLVHKTIKCACLNPATGKRDFPAKVFRMPEVSEKAPALAGKVVVTCLFKSLNHPGCKFFATEQAVLAGTFSVGLSDTLRSCGMALKEAKPTKFEMSEPALLGQVKDVAIKLFMLAKQLDPASKK